MRIDGSIPIHIARAYGVPERRAPVAATAPIAPAGAVEARSGNAASITANVRALIGAVVRGPIEFSAAAPVTGSGTASGIGTGAFQMYTRAADKIEAAVGVQLGRAVDVKG